MQAAPNARTITRPTYSIAISHSDITACAAPPAQSTAASLLRGQNPKGRSVPDRTACAASSAQVLGASASASCGTQTHKRTTQMASKAQKLIGGTAIRNLANRPRFSDLQISNRQQKGAKEMRHIAGIGGADMQLAPNARTSPAIGPCRSF
jgi:hypothetical protein